MRRLFALAVCLLFTALGSADDTDPEPIAAPDTAIKKLDADVADADKIGRDKVTAQRERLVKRLAVMHADLVKRGLTDKARDLKDRQLLAASLAPGKKLDTKLSVPKLLHKAAGNGRYRELLHVLHVPEDKASYTDFTDYGHSSTSSWAGHNNLQFGHWVYVYPRWYIWKELKP